MDKAKGKGTVRVNTEKGLWFEKLSTDVLLTLLLLLRFAGTGGGLDESPPVVGDCSSGKSDIVGRESDGLAGKIGASLIDSCNQSGKFINGSDKGDVAVGSELVEEHSASNEDWC